MNSPFTDDITSFLEMILAEAGVSLHTCSAYKSDLTDFQTYLNKKQSPPIPSQDINKYTIQNYIEYITSKGLHTHTIMRRLSTLRQFFQFLYMQKHITHNPCTEIETPKAERTLPLTPSKIDIDILCTQAKQQIKIAKTQAKMFQAKRLSAMVEMLYSSGMRVSELLFLKALPLSYASHSIHVTGKGNKTRMIILNEETLLQYNAYIEQGIQMKLWKRYPPDYAFVIPHKLYCPLTRQGFAKSLKKLAEQAGLNSEKFSPHSLRHAFASHLTENGADLRAVQKLLGHTHIATTEIYTHIQPERLLKTVNTYHPLSDTTSYHTKKRS